MSSCQMPGSNAKKAQLLQWGSIKKRLYSSTNVTKVTGNGDERPALEAVAKRSTTSRSAQSREEWVIETGLEVDMVLYG